MSNNQIKNFKYIERVCNKIYIQRSLRHTKGTHCCTIYLAQKQKHSTYEAKEKRQLNFY
jgi:hypothetical protein